MRHYKKSKFEILLNNVKEKKIPKLKERKEKCIDAGERLFNYGQRKVNIVRRRLKPIHDKTVTTSKGFVFKFMVCLINILFKLINKSINLLDKMVQWRRKHEHFGRYECDSPNQ